MSHTNWQSVDTMVSVVINHQMGMGLKNIVYNLLFFSDCITSENSDNSNNILQYD